MPTHNPRVNVTLSPSLDSLLGQLAGFERVSKSSVLRELLEAAEPSLRQAAALMQAAKGASVNARANVVRDLESSVRAAERVQRQALQVAANHMRDIVSEAEAIRGRRPSRAVAQLAGKAPAPDGSRGVNGARMRKDPPASNRGVK